MFGDGESSCRIPPVEDGPRWWSPTENLRKENYFKGDLSNIASALRGRWIKSDLYRGLLELRKSMVTNGQVFGPKFLWRVSPTLVWKGWNSFFGSPLGFFLGDLISCGGKEGVRLWLILLESARKEEWNAELFVWRMLHPFENHNDLYQ